MTLTSKYGIQAYSRLWPRSTSPNDLYLTYESCIRSEPNTDYDYMMMACLDYDVATNTMYAIVRNGSGHNAFLGQRFLLLKSVDGVAWTTIILPDLFVGSETIIDATVNCWPNGIILVTFGIRPDDGRIQYYTYSTDGGVTFTPRIRLTTDYDTPGQLLGVHRGYIENNIFYFCVYASTGINPREGTIYSIDIDDSATLASGGWTRTAKIYNREAALDGEEPSLFQLNDGTHAALVRSDPTAMNYLVWSPDNWQTISRPTRTFPSNGKSTGTITPSNLICSYGRKIPATDGDLQRTQVWWTKDTGETSFWDLREDARKYCPYHGGNFIWHPVKQKVVGVFTIEALYSTPYVGPSLLIYQEFDESPTPVTEVTALDVDYQSTVDFAQGAGATIPNSARKALENQLIIDLKADGIYEHLSQFTIAYHNDAGLGQFSLYNFTNGGWKYIANPINSPSYSADGFDFNGTNQYIDSNFIPSGSTKFLQNDASFGCWIEDNVAENGWAMGCSHANFASVSLANALVPRNASDQLRYCINDSTFVTIAGITDSRGFWMAQRRASNDKRMWHNGIQIDARADVSTGRTAVKPGIGCGVFANGPNLYSTRKVSFWFFGASLTGLELQFYNRLNAFRTAIAAL